LREYPDRLIHRFLNTKTLNLELKRIDEWKSPRRFETFNRGAYFCELAISSLVRIVLVDMARLLSAKEQELLIDWPTKTRENASSLEPTCYNPSHSSGECEPVKPK
jgi:hypothetical protein